MSHPRPGPEKDEPRGPREPVVASGRDGFVAAALRDVRKLRDGAATDRGPCRLARGPRGPHHPHRGPSQVRLRRRGIPRPLHTIEGRLRDPGVRRGGPPRRARARVLHHRAWAARGLGRGPHLRRGQRLHPVPHRPLRLPGSGSRRRSVPRSRPRPSRVPRAWCFRCSFWTLVPFLSVFCFVTGRSSRRPWRGPHP